MSLPPRRFLGGPAVVGLSVVAVFAAVTVFFKFQQFSALNTQLYDLGESANVLWNTFHGRPFWSSVMGENYLGQHFAPALALLPDTDLAGAHALAERLRRRVETCFACSGSDCNVRGAPGPMTLSAGCASRVPGFNEDPMTLILEADRRLYAAKVAGRNRVVATDDALPAAGGVA